MYRFHLATLAVLGSLLARPDDAAAQRGADRLSVYGHFTQSIGTSTDEPVAGIPVGMTTDLRSLALQFRYQTDEAGQAIVQLSHRRLGSSALAQVEPDLQVDWAFYRHRFGEFSVRGGRFPIPAGIYNDVRDVGTLLPLARAAHTIYVEGAETVDGVAATYALGVKDWQLELDAFVGGIPIAGAAQTPAGPRGYNIYFEKSFGARFWVRTPIENVEAGYSMIDFQEPGAPERSDVKLVSLKAEYDRFAINAEATQFNLSMGRSEGYYVQALATLTPRLRLVGQYESMDRTLRMPGMPEVENDFWRDRILGVNYRATSNVLLKLEGHSAKGYAFGRFVSPFGPPASSRYGIASISVSF